MNGRPARAAHEIRPGDRVAWVEPFGRFEEEVEILALPPEGASVSRAAARELVRRIGRREGPVCGEDGGAAGDGASE